MQESNRTLCLIDLFGGISTVQYCYVPREHKYSQPSLIYTYVYRHASKMQFLCIIPSLISLALALPGLPRVAPGLCVTPGEFLCISRTTFAICDDTLTGAIQPLAAGDPRWRCRTRV